MYRIDKTLITSQRCLFRGQTRIHNSQLQGLGVMLVNKACAKESIMQDQLILDCDNNGSVREQLIRDKIQDLILEASFGQPWMSDDNPFGESLVFSAQGPPPVFETSLQVTIASRGMDLQAHELVQPRTPAQLDWLNDTSTAALWREHRSPRGKAPGLRTSLSSPSRVLAWRAEPMATVRDRDLNSAVSTEIDSLSSCSWLAATLLRLPQ